MILNIFNSAKFLSKANTVTLQIVRMLEKLLLRFKLDWNLLLNCEQKDLLNLLFIFGDKKITLIDDLKKTNKKANWLNASRKTKLWKYFSEPIDHYVKKNSKTIVLDGGHLISNTDQSYESWPLELLATQLAKQSKNMNL